MTSKIFICLFFLSNFLYTGHSQSFEETSLPDLTTTPSASRSANFVDINGDGWDDIFITNGPFSGQDNMLYINNQNGTFTTITSDDIVSDNDRSDGASFADVDNDGDLDAFVVTFGANGIGKKNYFYRNNGDGSFTYEPNVAMGIPLTYSEMCSWIDINNDQNLDLYITNSVGSLNNLYFENQGDGSFEELTNLIITNEARASRSIDWVDYDGDGDNDLFITNEENETNSLFRNDGPNNFIQINNEVITLSFNNSAGSSWVDIDNDGDFDLFVANYANSGEANQLYINNGGDFTEITNSPVTSEITNSFGSTFGDVDNDGDLDLFVCNAYLAGQNTNSLFINNGDGSFVKDTSSNLANHQGNTFGAAFGDFDKDGWLDIVLANTENESETNSLFHNTGSGNNWVALNCQGTDSNTSAVGATVRLKATINGEIVWQTRSIASASGYCSQNSYTVHFGLGDATEIEELYVYWPFGTTESFSNLTINEFHEIIEGTGTLGQSETDITKFEFYPNPLEDTLHITTGSMTPIKNEEIRIYNTQGILVKKAIYNLSPSRIDVSSLPSGIYFFELSEKSKMKKFIKK
jgi:hypothetical protein